MLAAYVNSDVTSLRSGFFLQKLCLQGILHGNRKITPDEVIKEFNRKPDRKNKCKLAIARFKEKCYLRGMPLNGQPVIPNEVVKAYQAIGALRELAIFKSACCLRGPTLNNRRVTPEEVVKDFQAANALMELAYFKAECCLRGLLLNGKPVTADTVAGDFPDSPKGQLGLAHFKEECCFRGLLLNDRQVTPEAVVRGFPDTAQGRLGRARFKAECCLRGLALNGQPVTTDEVVTGFPDTGQGRLGRVRFKAECCLRGLALNGQQVTTDEVVKEYQAIKAILEIVRFKEECCLRGRRLNGQEVLPDTVVKGFERGGWLLEKAIFYSRLVLNARELNGNYLDDRDVLEAFNAVPGVYSLKQSEYLVQRLKQPLLYDETNKAQDIIQKAWQLSYDVSVKDEQHQLHCVLKFIALQNELTIDQQSVSAEQVLQSIETLRHSYQSLRLHFYFLAYCYLTGQSVNGRQIRRHQVLKCLKSFPQGSNHRHALGRWLEQYSSAANTMDRTLFKRENTLAPGIDSPQGFAASASQRGASVTDNTGKEGPYQVKECRDKKEHTPATQAVTAYIAQILKQRSGGPGFPDQSSPQLNALTLKALEIIQEVNGSYPNPPILITGSYARFLQNLCSLFNDIDVICTTKESADTLFEKLRALNTGRNSAPPKSIIITEVPGCPQIRLPDTHKIRLIDGDLNTRAMEIQVSIDNRVTEDKTERLAVHVPGVERPVRCVSFAEETRLMIDTLEHLTENLDKLTSKLQKGELFDIPRTLIFQFPQHINEFIFGLLMRSLLTLNKARQFIALHCESQPGETDYPDNHLQKPLQERRLHTLTENLQMKLHNHTYRHAFEQRVNGWLATTPHVNDFQIKRKEFIKALLAMMQPEKDRANSTR